MQIGQRNKRAVLYRATPAPDGQGGRDVTWAEYGRAWVNLIPLSGAEAILAGQVTGVLKTKLTMNFRDDVLVKDRAVIEGRTLEFDSVADVTGFNDELTFVCSETQA